MKHSANTFNMSQSYRYKKSGVMQMELQPKGMVQATLFDDPAVLSGASCRWQNNYVLNAQIR